MADYYDVLGVGRDSTTEEIKKRFRTLARETHPDANPGDPAAEERFREIAEAYEVLSDPVKRRAYDRGETFAGDLFSQFAGLDDILQQFFGGTFGGFGGTRRGGPARGADVAVAVRLTLEEAALGTSREVDFTAPVTCDTCGGSGAAAGSAPATCTTCRGAGAVQVARNTILGSVMTVSECAACSGTGSVITNPCETCRGGGRIHDKRTLTIEIPAGVDDGTRLRLAGKGSAGERGAPAGDLYVQVRLEPDERFERRGDDLHFRLRLGVSEATFGADVPVPLIEGGDMEVDIPAGTQPGTVFRLARQGMPRLRRRGRGDMLVEVVVDIPTELSGEEEEALRTYGELRGERPAPPRRKRRFRTG